MAVFKLPTLEEGQFHNVFLSLVVRMPVMLVHIVARLDAMPIFAMQ